MHKDITLPLIFAVIISMLSLVMYSHQQYTCNGISSASTSTVCFGRGTCVAQDTCTCKPIYTGKFCQDYTNCTTLLKSAENIAVFGNNLNINGCNQINGNIASAQSTNVASSCTVTGTRYTSAVSIYSDVQSTINNIFNNQPCDTTLSNPNFNTGSNTIIYPGVTCINQDLNLGGTITLDSKGSSFTRFYIKVSSGMNLNSQSNVVLTGGTLSCNVFWLAAGAVTLDQPTAYGNFMTIGSISLNSGVNLSSGRLLSLSTISINSASTYISTCACPSGLNTTFVASSSSGSSVTYPTVCNGIYSTNTSFVCSGGRGICITNNTCNCTSSYTGSICQYPICYGIASNQTTTVCSGRGTCQSPNTCSCSLGWSGNTCNTCTFYDDCGVCGGTNVCKQNANDTYNDGVHSLSEIQITQFLLRPLSYAELTTQERLEGVGYVEFSLNATAVSSRNVVYAEFDCISDQVSLLLDSRWTTSEVVSPLDSSFTIFMFKQRISLNLLYECYGSKFSNVITDSGITRSPDKTYVAGLINLSVHRKNGTECEISFQNWIAGQSDYGNVTYSEVYSVPYYFVISTSNTGVSVIQYTARGLGFSVTVFHKMWLQNGELALVLKTCVNKPAGNPILLVEDSHNATASTGQPKFVHIPSSYNGMCIGGDLAIKCCQFWKYHSVNGSGLSEFYGLKYFRWYISSATYPILNGKTVETALDMHIKRPDNLVVREDSGETNFDLSLQLFMDPDFTVPGSSFIDGYRIYLKASLTPLEDAKCNLFVLKLKKVIQCTTNTGDLPHSCTDFGVNTFLMYDENPDIPNPSEWDFEFTHSAPVSSIFLDCTSRLYMDWIAKIVKPSNFTNTFMLEIWWSYEYNLEFQSPVIFPQTPPPNNGLMKQNLVVGATSSEKKKKKSSKLTSVETVEDEDSPISTSGITVSDEETEQDNTGGSRRRNILNIVQLTVTCPSGTIYNEFFQRCVQQRSFAMWFSIILATMAFSASCFLAVFFALGFFPFLSCFKGDGEEEGGKSEKKGNKRRNKKPRTKGD